MVHPTTERTAIHEVRPSAARCILGGLVISGLCVVIYPDRFFSPVGIEQVLRLLFAGLFFMTAVAIFISSAFGWPQLRWTENDLTFTDLVGRTTRLRLADLGPATPHSTYHRGFRIANFLLFRPISGGKVISLGLSCYGHTEAQLAELADRINKTRGMPTGSTDAQALMENRNSMGLFLLLFLLVTPLVLVLYLLFLKNS
jgi:hypothetical protein